MSYAATYSPTYAPVVVTPSQPQPQPQPTPAGTFLPYPDAYPVGYDVILVTPPPTPPGGGTTEPAPTGKYPATYPVSYADYGTIVIVIPPDPGGGTGGTGGTTGGDPPPGTSDGLASQSETPPPRVLTPVQVLHFSTPGIASVLGNDRLGRFFTFVLPQSLLKIDGQWVLLQAPDMDTISVADAFYQGGQDYVITQVEADELTAAGYGGGITEETIYV